MKKIISFFLAVLLMMTIVPFSAFAQNSDSVSTSTSEELTTKADSALGDVLASAMSEDEEERNAYDGNGIYNVSISGFSAEVSFAAPDNSTLVVAVYDEDTMKMITTGNAAVDSDTRSVTVELAEYDVLPDYYIIKAFILDSENAPVCKNYENKDYTKAYQEFSAKNIYDFEEDKVINLDYDYETNFAVVTDAAQTVTSSAEENTVVVDDYENGKYVIENANEEITSLSVGDIFYYVYGDEADDYILTKIGTIENNNGTLTITAAENCEMSELFQYVDIDTSAQSTASQLKARGIFNDDEGDVNEDKYFDISSGEAEKEFKGDHYSLKLKVTGKIGFHVKFKYDFKLFGKDYYEFSYWLDVYANANATFTATASFSKEMSLIDANFTVVPGLDIHFALKITVKASASLTLVGDLTFEMKYGAKTTSDTGMEKIEQKPTITPNIDVEGSFTIDFIPEIQTGFTVLKVFFADLSVPVDFQLNGELFVPTSSDEKASHSCYACISGDISATINLGITVSFGLKRDKAITIIDVTPYENKIPFGSYYISISSGSGVTFGWGTCPNSGSSSGGTGDTDNTGGTDTEYSPNTSGVKDSGTCGDNVTWTLYNDGELLISGTGAMTNYTHSSSAPWHSNINSITIATIEDSVTTIGICAFEDCASLESVTIPNSVTSIGNWAFEDCDSLTSVTIPNKVTTIGGAAFNSCDSLASVTIPNSVNTIGSYAFKDCTSLASVTVDENNQNYSNDEYGVLFNKDKTTLIQYPIGNNRTAYTIPNNVISIGYSAFKDCANLASITIPDSVTTIDNEVFYGCNSLKSVTIGNSVTTIGSYAFKDCTSLASITIPDSVTSIDFGVFSSCECLESIIVDENNQNYSNDEYGVLFNKDKTVLIQYPIGNSRTEYTIPNSVTIIFSWAFRHCKNLTCIAIPNSVTTIDNGAFEYCESLESITIPDSVTTIENEVFYACNSLESITIPDSVTTIDDEVFYGCNSLESVTIGNSVTSIGEGAFRNCNSLESITIPDRVTTIGDYAFYGCNNIESVTIGNSVTTIGNFAFLFCLRLKTVYYTGTQEQWNKISIGSNNTKLTSSNIICSDTVATTSVMALSLDDGIAAYSDISEQIATVINAVIGNEYVILVVKDTNAEDLLAPENLIYIDQKTADNTELTFDFNINSETDYDVIITNAKCSHYHSYTSSATVPTCTEQGYTTYTCSCGDIYTDNYISATGHKNTNSDAYCDSCGYDFSAECSHNCHSSNAFVRFFWKIALFFSKLFNIQSNRYCECGVAHW